MDDATKTAITERLTEIVIDLVPDANLRAMYGGIVIELETDNPKSRIGGFFVYEKYVSLELAQGTQLNDPDGVLEGKGKFRRHLKLHDLEDVTKKNCADFLRQAIALDS